MYTFIDVFMYMFMDAFVDVRLDDVMSASPSRFGERDPLLQTIRNDVVYDGTVIGNAALFGNFIPNAKLIHISVNIIDFMLINRNVAHLITAALVEDFSDHFVTHALPHLDSRSCARLLLAHAALLPLAVFFVVRFCCYRFAAHSIICCFVFCLRPSLVCSACFARAQA